MSSSRNWCPALSAAPEVLTVYGPPSPPRERPLSPSKNKGSEAAKTSINAAAGGAKLVDRVRSERKFSNRLALSVATAEESAALAEGAGEVPFPIHYSSVHNRPAAPAPDAEGQLPTLARPVLIRNIDHWKKVQGRLDGHNQPTNVVLSDCDISTAQLQELLDGPLEGVEGLTLQRSLHGTNAAQALCTTLLGGVPPPEEPPVEEEQAPIADDDEEEQQEEEEPQPVKEPWRPKQHKVKCLKLSGNPVGFGCAVGEEPSGPALEELGKLLQQSEVTPLQQVSFANCDLQSTGGAAVATAVLQSGSIVSLDLSENGIGKGDEGSAVTAVAQLLQENKFLTTVDLSGNDFDPSQMKQIIEALANSKTRVATPEPAPEPEPEEYTDELPLEEEPPTVEIGFPKEETEEAAQEGEGEGEEGEGEGVEGEDGEAPADDEEKKAEVEEGEEEEEEEEEETAAPIPEAKPEPEAEGEAEEDEEDEEAAEERRRLEEEKAEAEREAYEAAKAAWEEKQEQYIWGPQRIHSEWDETVARREIMQAHITETTELKNEERASRAAAKERQLVRERLARERRSGWTHLKSLNLSGNPMGSEGGKTIAEMLRKKIPLTEDEFQQAEEAADEYVRKATEAAEEAAAAKAEEERLAKEAEEERKAAEAEAAKEAAEAAAAEAGNEQEGKDEGEAAEDVPEEGTKETPETEGEGEPEKAAEEEPEEQAIPSIQRPEVRRDRDGVATLEALSLGSCSIGTKGLKALAATLKDNNDTLRTLILKRNKFGVKHSEVAPPDATEDDDPPKPMLRIDVTEWVSPGVAALGETLCVNQTLVVLDLSYNNMYPATLKTLVEGLTKNRVLEVLLLDGNHLGQESILEELLGAIGGEDSAITTLGLSSAGIASALNIDVATKLCECISLRSLNLDSNELTASELTALSTAVSKTPANSWRLRALSLQNNDFIGEEAGTALGSIAKITSTLHSLRISGNAKFGDAGFRALSEGLLNHSGLQIFAASRVGSTKADKLAEALVTINFLRELDLSDNEISEEDGLKLVEQVRRCAAITNFSLWGRNVDHESASMPLLLEAVQACPTLMQADLGQGLASATALNVPAADAEEEEDDEELMTDAEKVELYCLKNRIIAAL